MELSEDDIKEIERCVNIIREKWKPYSEAELRRRKSIYIKRIQEKKERKKNARLQVRSKT